MNLLDLTPIMTSDTTPAPYAVYASNYDTTNSSASLPYRAFNKQSTYTWTWGAGIRQAWIDFWFNEIVTVDYVKIECTSAVTYPKQILIYGSNDRSTYNLIYDTGTISNTNYPLLIKIPRSKYKCFRLDCVGVNQTSTYIKHTINNIYYYQDLDYTNPSEIIKEAVKNAIKNNTLIQKIVTATEENK